MSALQKAAMRVMEAWDETVLPKARDGMMQERMEELRAALAEQPAEQEPVAWQILNGLCHAGIRSSESLANEAAAGMQKTHDLGGSLAAFHVRPLYTAPQPRKRLTDEEIRNALRFCFEWEGQVDEAMLMHIDEYRAIEDAIWSKT